MGIATILKVDDETRQFPEQLPPQFRNKVKVETYSITIQRVNAVLNNRWDDLNECCYKTTEKLFIFGLILELVWLVTFLSLLFYALNMPIWVFVLGNLVITVPIVVCSSIISVILMDILFFRGVRKTKLAMERVLEEENVSQYTQSGLRWSLQVPRFSLHHISMLYFPIKWQIEITMNDETYTPTTSYHPSESTTLL